jgi:hypothetical protein
VSGSGSNLPVVVRLFDPSAEFATNIADVYPNKEVTLIHSRDQPLPRFDKQVHDAGTTSLQLLVYSATHGLRAPAMDRLRGMNVRTLLNTRIDLSSLKAPPFSPYRMQYTSFQMC